MREVKFKAWDCKNNEWVYYSAGEHLPENCNDNSLINWQYTGLKDKNGKEIYEGDILIFSIHGLGESLCKCLYDEGCFELDVIGQMTPFPMNNLKNRSDIFIEVIGNIYENPELLK
jgi:uncharacterized phage protein (TIGR01671 family)